MSARDNVINELIETVEEVIETISEQELQDADLVLAREIAEQLKEELFSLRDGSE